MFLGNGVCDGSDGRDLVRVLEQIDIALQVPLGGLPDGLHQGLLHQHQPVHPGAHQAEPLLRGHGCQGSLSVQPALPYLVQQLPDLSWNFGFQLLQHGHIFCRGGEFEALLVGFHSAHVRHNFQLCVFRQSLVTAGQQAPKPGPDPPHVLLQVAEDEEGAHHGRKAGGLQGLEGRSGRLLQDPGNVVVVPLLHLVNSYVPILDVLSDLLKLGLHQQGDGAEHWGLLKLLPTSVHRRHDVGIHLLQEERPAGSINGAGAPLCLQHVDERVDEKNILNGRLNPLRLLRHPHLLPVRLRGSRHPPCIELAAAHVELCRGLRQLIVFPLKPTPATHRLKR
mmetsp:Transcript_32075/g.90950  ORF Transcript_32075/g.90950 Transcript_32075/m.90950 type:complete len:336 (+) Transcript_32075:1208-2215(+)